MTSTFTSAVGSEGDERLSSFWDTVVDLLAARPDRAGSHGLGPLTAVALRRRSLPVPKALARQEQRAALRMAATRPLLGRLRGSSSGELLLMKGAEVALRYPESARQFSDIDLLVPDARRTHRELLAAGFVEVGDPELFYRIHHLRPLIWPTLPLAVEIHSAPKWPARMRPPGVEQILEAAVPSETGVDGILAPRRVHHALLLAAHAWAHEPLLRVRDLIDAGALAEEADPHELENVARAWRIDRLWQTTAEARDAILGRRRPTVATLLWAGHLPEFRERTVLENHLQEWLSGYWALSPHAALVQMLGAFLDDVRPAPEEGWRDKLGRAMTAFRNAGSPLSRHNEILGDAATRGQRRNPPDDLEA